MKKSAFVALAGLILIAALVAQQPAAKAAKDAPAGHGNLQTLLEQKEKAGWEAYRNKDAKGFRQLCWPEYTAVLADGAGERNLESTLAAMKEITILNYTLSGFRLTVVGPQSAVLTYKATAKLQIGKGQPQDSKMDITDVWVKRNGEWKSVRYHESETK
jgi:ketosteroid isomerase-like protein